MTSEPAALAKINEWTSICGDKPELTVKELAALGFIVVRRDHLEAKLVDLEERARAAEAALVGLTADGSEFYRRNPDRSSPQEFIVDVSACVDYVRDRLDRMRISMLVARREVRELRWPAQAGVRQANPIEDEIPCADMGEAIP
ncbi:hypothetical protein [Methylobacterium sp. Leaf112]|uniref:hypothetical protein n=1 Tax=Methylobacterium sp. Leaf112 TaxID=1736258 RepID=UPI0006F4E8AC|nr:hypothetical protein [Methylobacterium sp. Leaf112]KQP72368.1 hypothetical protein ASF52_02295 [Methylobacterium sp. Leaf112]